MDTRFDFAFVVDTRQYSGNFEREMTSYVTGAEGEYHGEKEAALFKMDVSNETILTELNDKKCEGKHDEYDWVICSICPTPGRVNNGTGVHTDAGEGMSNAVKVWPAYESVAMFFSEIPSDSLIAFMKDRAYCFGEINDLTIVGFRLLTQKTVVTEMELVL